MHKYVVGVLLVSAGLLVGACAAVGTGGAELPLQQGIMQMAQPQNGSISVTGFGQAVGRPDVAIFTLGVESKASTLQQAYENSNRTTEAVMQALRDMGIAESDLHSTNFNVWREDLYDRETGKPSGEVLYHVDSSLSVRVREIDRVSEIIQGGLDAGGTSIWGLSFAIEDRKALESQARELALADAHARGLELAAALGVELGEATHASELAGGGLIMLSGGAALERGLGGGGNGPPLSLGDYEILVQVDVVYALER